MRKSLAFISGALLIGAASCSQEEVVSPVAGGGNVNFQVSLPAGGYGTRAFSDGLTAENLKVAVYDADGDKLVTTTDAVFNNSLQTTVSLNLANGKAYKIVFFASKESQSVYDFDTETATLSVDYAKMTDYNSEDYDCFYVMEPIEVVTGPITKTVTLTRPLAQVNWGTADLGVETISGGNNPAYGANAENLKSSATFSGATVYTKMNMLDGEVSEPVANNTLTFTALERPSADEPFPVEGYEYLSMAYLLVAEDNALVDAKLTITGGGEPIEVKVPSMPIQRNYRTNVYGNLITSPSDWNVEIKPGYNEPANGVTTDNLKAGGTISVIKPQEELEIPETLENPLTLNIASEVGTLKMPASNEQPITINVMDGVPYPDFDFVQGSTLKDLTIVGNPKSEETFEGFVFLKSGALNVTTTNCPKLLENLTLDGIHFDNGAVVPQYTTSFKNMIIKNCVFDNCVSPAVGIQFANGGTNTEYGENITIENCVINFSDNAPAQQNGLYLLDINGDIIVKNNTINGSNFHGISISANEKSTNGTIALAQKIEVTGNTISGTKTRDGIKIQNETEAEIIVSGNTITVTENGIRIKDSLNGNSAEVCNNTLDLKNIGAWNANDNEVCAILLINTNENENAVTLKVDNNTIQNKPEDDRPNENIVNIKRAE